MSTDETVDKDRRPIRVRNSQWAHAAARLLAACGISPNSISMIGMIAAIVAGVFFYFTRGENVVQRTLWFTGALLVLVRLLANMLDGMVAIELGRATRVGTLYNEVPDRISDCAVLIGAGYGAGGSAELGYVAACVALFVAYVRATTRNAGAPSDFGGPMAKQQRMYLIIAAALYSAVAPVAWRFTWGPQRQWGTMACALVLVVVGGLLTAALRLGRAARVLKQA